MREKSCFPRSVGGIITRRKVYVLRSCCSLIFMVWHLLAADHFYIDKRIDTLTRRRPIPMIYLRFNYNIHHFALKLFSQLLVEFRENPYLVNLSYSRQILQKVDNQSINKNVKYIIQLLLLLLPQLKMNDK